MASPLPAPVFIGLVAFQPLDLAGPVGLRVNVGTTSPSMHLHAKLADVAPDGSARMLVRGQEYLADPDPDRAVEIRLRHTGYRLQPGHRLRVHLACSDYPFYLWHPGTQANPWHAGQGQRNEQSLVTGGPAPSHLSITVHEDKWRPAINKIEVPPEIALTRGCRECLSG